MMLPHALILWLVPLLGLAYTPPPHEILSRMETTLRKSVPVEVDIVREDPKGAVIGVHSMRIPAESRADLGDIPGQAILFSLRYRHRLTFPPVSQFSAQQSGRPDH